MAKKTEFEYFLDMRNLDKFEYEKIVPNKVAWNKLMKEWEKYQKENNLN